jgi:hypothetical protein
VRSGILGTSVWALCWDGNSETAETVPGVGNGYPSHVMPQLARAPMALYTNIAVSGATDFHLGYDVNSGHKRAGILLIGTNIYRAGGTATTCEAAFSARISALRGVGYQRVILTTCPPSVLITGANEVSRLAGNRALSGLGADGVIDLAGDPICGNVANYSNGVVGTDGTHATATGCIQWARVAVPVIQGLLV